MDALIMPLDVVCLYYKKAHLNNNQTKDTSQLIEMVATIVSNTLLYGTKNNRVLWGST